MRLSNLRNALVSISLVVGTIQADLVNTAPYDPSQFANIGTITSMTLKDGGTPLLGGTITVDGIPMIIPDNTIATLPAAAVAWSELFTAAGSPDLPGFPATQWKATVVGNRVNDQYIVGLVFIAQDPGRIIQGFITSIDHTTGFFKLAGSIGDDAGVIDCVISDPLGVYGPKYTANPLWSVDPVNPSVHALTGFPMCIPRVAAPLVDDLCPMKNRPIDPATQRPVTTMTFFDPATITANQPDANVMAPLVVGDYVTISGQQVGTCFEVNNLVANIGFWTAPGTKPSYITVELAAFGILLPLRVDPPETRAVAFTTDPSTPVTWFAMDQDECTGVVTERAILTVQPQQVAPIGRVVFRMGKTPVSRPTRNTVFRAATGTSITQNNLTSGQFVQPTFDFIFPEIVNFGANAEAFAFQSMDFLLKGSGPYVPGNVAASPQTGISPVIGQLDPWPGAAVSARPDCPSLTSSSSASATPSAPLTPDVVVDTITIVSATKIKTRGGAFQISVSASTDNVDAQLFLAVAGAIPVAASPMTNQGGGLFQLTVLTKGAPTSVTVTSSAKGTPATSTV